MTEPGKPSRFFYQRHGGTYGPVAKSELQHRANSKEILPDTLVREESSDSWKPASAFDIAFAPGGPPAQTSSPAKTTAPARNGTVGFVVAVVIIGGLAWWLWPSAGFAEADIANVKQSIRDEYAKKDSDLEIEEVAMLRKEPRELLGFVRMKHKPSGVTQTVDCSATMSAEGKTFIWRCGR